MDVIKNLEITFSWITKGGPKCHHKRPPKRGDTHREDMKMEAEFGMVVAQHQGMPVARNRFSSRAARGARPC